MRACAFRPDPGRAADLDRRARHALADSLGSVFAACSGELTWSSAVEAELLAALRAHAVAPALFGIYAELVEAVCAEDRGAAQALIDMLLRKELRTRAGVRVVTLDEAGLGAGLPGLYVRAVDDDPGTTIRMSAVNPAELARGRALYSAAAGLLRAAAPDLLDEMQILAHETVLVCDAAAPGDGEMGFDGGSTFYLWGAVILNIARQQTRTGIAEALAHETGHAYLFGATLGAPLVENDPAERYKSPLRTDPRPMDGLVHASFVLARMVWCQDRLLLSGLLDTAERTAVATARALNHARFLDTIPVIEAQARFTVDGGPLWLAARNWMEAGCPA